MNYLNLNRKHKVQKKIIVQEEVSEPSKEWSILSTPAASPYTLFYPDAVTTNISLVADDLDPSKSVEFGERVNYRSRKKAYFVEQASSFEQYGKSNLAAVHKAFMQLVSDDGILSKVDFMTALQSLGITDEHIMNSSYELFDSSREGIVDYKEVISALDVILNGLNKHCTFQNAFKLFDPTNCGWIIQECVREIKQGREERDGVNHMMVKALLDIFDKLQGEEEERMKKDLGKKGKKRKKKNLANVVLPKYSPKMHLSYEEFCEFLGRDAFVVQAFLTSVLYTMEEVYKRNKKHAQQQQARQSYEQKRKDTEEVLSSVKSEKGGEKGSAAAAGDTESLASSHTTIKKSQSIRSAAKGSVPPSPASAPNDDARSESARSTVSTAKRTTVAAPTDATPT